MALPITPSLVEDAAAGLAGDGWRYTQRQLYYATCARAETPRSNAAANGEIGFGVLLVLVGLILIAFKVLFALFVTLGVALALAGVLARRRKPPVTARLLALSFDEFRSRFGGLQLPGLLDPDAGHAGAVATPPDTMVICDTSETAVMVAANLERSHVGGAVLVTAQGSMTPHPGATVVALHDASPADARSCSTFATPASPSRMRAFAPPTWTIRRTRCSREHRRASPGTSARCWGATRSTGS